MLSLKILRSTDTHIYILTDEKHQLKLATPGFKNKKQLMEWLEIVSSDYDKMIEDQKS